MIPMDSITPTPIPTSTQIDYPLPYPGILPGRPLYIVKAIRDKFWEITTMNAVRKTEFFLLQADKNISAALYLNSLGDRDRAIKSFIKGQNYIEKAIEQENIAKKTSGSVIEISGKIKQASKKQTELIKTFNLTLKGIEKSDFKKEVERAEKLEKRAEEFRLQ